MKKPFCSPDRDNLQQPIPAIHAIHAEVTAAALPVMPRGLGNDQRCLDRVTQSDETVAQFDGAVECLDLVLQMAQLTDGAREPFAGADESHVVPHDILDGLHIALDERRVRILRQA
jgi:hypothetical protein